MLSPYIKGALGFLGCAGICTIAYQLGKSAGREETLREIEQEERLISQQELAVPVQQQIERLQETTTTELSIPQQPETPVERVRKMHGLKSKIFGGTSVIKDLLSNPDGKKLTMTVENGDIVARISQKGGQ